MTDYLKTMNSTETSKLLFHAQWRNLIEAMDQQRHTLTTLWEEADKASKAVPSQLPINLPDIKTEEQIALMENFWTQLNTFTIAKQIYANAIVFFYDTSFDYLKEWYNKATNVKAKHHIGNLDLFEIIDIAGNNIRHQREWLTAHIDSRNDSNPERRLGPVRRNIHGLAEIFGRQPPRDEELSLFAKDYSWEILKKLSDGTYEGLEKNVYNFADSLLSNLDLLKSLQTIEAKRKHHQPTS